MSAWPLPDKESLMGYYGGVKAAAREYIESLSASDLERQLDIPHRPRASIGSFLGVMVFDNTLEAITKEWVLESRQFDMGNSR